MSNHQNSFSTSITCITYWKNLARHYVNELWYIIIISIFIFLIFKHFTSQTTLKRRLVQKLNLTSKFSSIKRQINIPLWTHMGHKEWRKDEKTFIRHYRVYTDFSHFSIMHFFPDFSLKTHKNPLTTLKKLYSPLTLVSVIWPIILNWSHSW